MSETASISKHFPEATDRLADERVLAPVFWGMLAERYPTVVHIRKAGADATLCGRSKGMILEEKIVKESKWFWDAGNRSTEIPESRFCKNCFKHFNGR